MKTGRIFALFLLVAQTFGAAAQGLPPREAEAGKLYRGYDFDGAAAIYSELLKGTADSLARASLMEKALLCENGKSLLQFANEPQVVTSKTFAASDFFLYYSHLADGGWIPSPNAFSSGKDPLYFDRGARSLVFSAPDSAGHKKLFSTTLGQDGLWSAPEVVERCASSGNEIFPLVSASGEELYFSSDALAGMGGYDLFVSRWNERHKRWEAPQNLGFPYSSVGDDFLFSNTPDGEFTLLASNRDCGADSVTIYVLKFENAPLSKPVNAAEARRIASLIPQKRGAEVSTASQTDPREENSLAPATLRNRWKAAYGRLGECREAIREAQSRRDAASSDKEVLEAENRIMELQGRYTAITDSVKALEIELIAEGGRPDYGTLDAAETPSSTSAVAPRTGTYKFVRHSFGKLPEIQIEQPEVEEDPYVFSIGSVGEVVNEFPTGTVFQIQLAVVSNKMSVKQLRGLRPVFAKRQSSGKYLYTVGAFRHYSEAVAALPLVKGAGFSSAYIVAFKNGRSIAVSKARAETE